MGGTVGELIGLTDGGVIAQTRGEQIGGTSIVLLQIAWTSPLTQLQLHLAIVAWEKVVEKKIVVSRMIERLMSQLLFPIAFQCRRTAILMKKC